MYEIEHEKKRRYNDRVKYIQHQQKHKRIQSQIDHQVNGRFQIM